MGVEQERSFSERVALLQMQSKAKVEARAKTNATAKKQPPKFRGKDSNKHMKDMKSKSKPESNKKKFKETSAQALALNTELQALARAKKTQEAIALYNDVTYKDIIDTHHAAIVVNACVRGGAISSAERIVRSLESKGPVSVQAYTTLMKGYAHCGDVSKSLDILKQMCDKTRIRTRNLRPNVRTFNTFLRACLWGNPGSMLDEGWDLYSKALRSCNDHNDVVFDASSYEYYVSVACASLRVQAAAQKLHLLEQAAQWESYEKGEQHRKENSSSTLSMTDAQTNISADTKSKKRMADEGQSSSQDYAYDRSADSLSEYGEAYASGLLAVARAELMLSTEDSTVLTHIRIALEVIAQMENLELYQDGEVHDPHALEEASRRHNPGSGKRMGVNVRGGKRAKAGGDELRMESNRKFRGHKLREIKGGLIQLRARYESLGKLGADSVVHAIATEGPDGGVESKATTENTRSASLWGEDTLAQMYRQFFFFSGGGSTDQTAAMTENKTSERNGKGQTSSKSQKGRRKVASISDNVPVIGKQDEDPVKQVMAQLMRAAECFGYGRHRQVESSDAIEGGNKTKKLNKYQQQLQARKNRKRRNLNIYYNLIDRSGRIKFEEVFASASQLDAPLFLELGAGTGDWITEQANAYPNHNYVSVELRADRVAQTFSAVCLAMNSDKDTYAPLRNVCVIGGDCGDVLRKRVQGGSVQGIFVNHPEPPTQSGETNDSTHMLNQENLKACIECLVDTADQCDASSAVVKTVEEPDMVGTAREIESSEKRGESSGNNREAGSLVIVSDNIFYTLALAKSLVELMQTTNIPFRNKDCVDTNTDAVYVRETVRGDDGTYVHVYEGTPGRELGYVEGVESRSYFDRLWQTGAGSHATEKVRYLLVVERGQRVPETEVTHSSGEYGAYPHAHNSAYSHTDGAYSVTGGAEVIAKNKRMRFDEEGDDGTVVTQFDSQKPTFSGTNDLSSAPTSHVAKNKKSVAKQQRRNERRLEKKRLAELAGGKQ